MTDKLNLSRTLPIGGIVAFSLCSTWNLYHLFAGHAAHPTPIFWAAAALVEMVTAWLVFQVVETARYVTRSNISQQDRRFYGILLAVFITLALPTLGASVWANMGEFGSVWLGLLFPVASVACAIGAALPGVATRYEARKTAQKQEHAQAKRKREKEREKARAEVEKQLEKERESALRSLGNAAQTLRIIIDNPDATQEQVAALAGISRRTVVNHLNTLEAAGRIKRNGHGLEVI